MNPTNAQYLGCAAGAIALYGVSVVGGYRLISVLDDAFAWSRPSFFAVGEPKAEEPVYISDETERAELVATVEPTPAETIEPARETAEAPPVSPVENAPEGAPGESLETVASEAAATPDAPLYQEPVADLPPAALSATAFHSGLGGGFDAIPDLASAAPVSASTPRPVNSDRPAGAANRGAFVPVESPAEAPAAGPPSNLGAGASLETPVAKLAAEAKVANPLSVSAKVSDLPALGELAIGVEAGLGGQGAVSLEVPAVAASISTARTSGPEPGSRFRQVDRAVSNRGYLRALGGSVSGLIGGVDAPPAGSVVDYRPIAATSGNKARHNSQGILPIHLPSADFHSRSSRGSAPIAPAINSGILQVAPRNAVPNVRPSAITTPVKNLLPQVGVNATNGLGVNVGLGGMNLRVNTGLLR